jgi:toxin ParE1/3/4
VDIQIVWTPAARDDLKDIVSYIAQDNPDAAQRVGDQIIESVEMLRTMPESGRVVPERNDETIRELVRGNYRIIHKVALADSRIEIWRIWHGARGEPGISE